jgi:hypothetical protein
MTPHAPLRLFVPSEAGFARCFGEIRQPPMPELEPQPSDSLTETRHEPCDRTAAHGFVASAFRLLGIAF